MVKNKIIHSVTYDAIFTQPSFNSTLLRQWYGLKTGKQTGNVISDFFWFHDYFVIMWRKKILCHIYFYLKILFFSYLDRHQVMYPLQFTRLLGLVDVEVLVDAGGPSSQVKIFVKDINLYFNFSKFVPKICRPGQFVMRYQCLSDLL